MRIAIMGSGALGGFFGCRLAAHGIDTTFIARGRVLAALAERGIRLSSPTLGEMAAHPVKATGDPARIGPVDAVLFTVKAYQIDEAARAMQPLIGAETAVVPLLNGLEITDRIAAVVGTRPVLGGMSYVAAAMPEPAAVKHFGNDGFLFGEPTGGLSPRVERIAATFAKAGIPATASADIQKDIWTKALMFCATGGLMALTRKSFGALARDPDVRRAFEGVIGEVERVARAKGIALAPDVIARTLKVVEAFPPDGTSSMLRDVVAGRWLEIETVNGALVRQAHALGLKVPYNETVYAGLKLLAEGQSSP